MELVLLECALMCCLRWTLSSWTPNVNDLVEGPNLWRERNALLRKAVDELRMAPTVVHCNIH